MKRMLFILLLVPAMLSAQKYLPGRVEFKNGKTIDCLLKIPSNPSDKMIETRLSEKAKTVKYESDKLSKVIVTSRNGATYELSRENMPRLLSKKTDEVWLLVAVKGYATLYSLGNGFKINKKGEMIVVAQGAQHVAGDFYFLVKRPDEKVTTIIGLYTEQLTINMHRTFRKLSAEYFKDCPELVKRIENKEFKVLDCGEMVMEYNKYKEEKM